MRLEEWVSNILLREIRGGELSSPHFFTAAREGPSSCMYGVGRRNVGVRNLEMSTARERTFNSGFPQNGGGRQLIGGPTADIGDLVWSAVGDVNPTRVCYGRSLMLTRRRVPYPSAFPHASHFT